VEKQKELWYAKVLLKDKAEGSSAPYIFNVLTQLANIPERITLYELLRLSKSTREVLGEALVDAEAFMARIPAKLEEDKEDCLHASQLAPCITFTPGDMKLKGKHDRPMYFTGYIGSFEMSRIQLDPGSALSVMPRLFSIENLKFMEKLTKRVEKRNYK